MTLCDRFKAPVAVVFAVLILTGCGAMTGRQSAGEALDDTAVTTKVKSNLLADSAVSATAIDVDTNAGAVSLSGFVTSEKERQRAIQVAQNTQGVRQVDARNLVIRR
jgi:hyperosmotically inducible protein